MLLRKTFFALLVLGFAFTARAVEQWDVADVALKGPTEGNPFLDVTLTARFTCGDKSIDVNGFYDGEGTYRIRFMPPSIGTWKYQTHSNQSALDSQSGEMICDKPGPDNHGPVRVRNTFHFAYADGTPYKPVGTTAYGWLFQPASMQEQSRGQANNSTEPVGRDIRHSVH